MMTNLYKEHRIKCTIVVYDILTLTSSVGLYIVAMQGVAPWDSCEPLHHTLCFESNTLTLRCRTQHAVGLIHTYLDRERIMHLLEIWQMPEDSISAAQPPSVRRAHMRE